MSKTTTVAKLRVGQRFSWVPAHWYGPCKLLYKSTPQIETNFYSKDRPVIQKYDLKYDARVVNPPGWTYGVPGTTRVRLLTPTWKLKRRANARNNCPATATSGGRSR